MSITFKKKVSSTPSVRLPAGTRLNSSGTLLLTSSGISSLDAFIGGGLPVGSLLLIYEDQNCNLSDSILRCYLSEGIYSKHDLCVAALRTDPTENLPTKEENLAPSNDRTEEENEKMKIAWRYENLSSLDSSSASSVHYDLQSTKPIPNELLEQVKIHKLTWDSYARSQSPVSYRNYLLQTLRTLLTTDYSSQQAEKRILRIGIQSLSLSLFDDQSEHHFDELFAFLYHMRVLLRTSLATCVITLDEKSKLFETVADLVFELKVSQMIHSDYVAFCQLIKLPRLNTIQPFIPDTWDIAIKLIKHRKNLIFEKYSIPPDLSAEASREDKNKSLACTPSKQLKLLGLGVCLVDVMMDEEEDDTSAFRQHLFDLSIKRSNSSPALPLLVNTAENDMQFDDVDFCDSKLRRHSSSFSSHQSRLTRFAHIMKNELTNPIVDEASQERDLHDNLKMSISFTDLAVGDEQQAQQPAHSIDSRRSSVNSSDSSNLCYSSSPSPSTPARPCAVVSNQRQCYSPALQQQVAPFQCYLASPPSRSQSPIGMMTNNNNNNNSSAKITSFPPNLKRKQGDDAGTGANSKKSRIASDNESLFGPTNSPESPSPGLVESNSNLLTTQQSLNLLSSIPPSLSSSSSISNGNDNTHFKPIHHPDNDLFPPPNSPSICPSPTNSTCSSSSLTFTPISPASTTSSSSSSFLLLPANFTRATIVSSFQSSGLIVPSATKHLGINTNCSKMKLSNKSHFQRDRSLDEASSLQPLSVLLPRPTTMQEKSDSPTTEEQFFFSSDDATSTTAQ